MFQSTPFAGGSASASKATEQQRSQSNSNLADRKEFVATYNVSITLSCPCDSPCPILADDRGHTLAYNPDLRLPSGREPEVSDFSFAAVSNESSSSQERVSFWTNSTLRSRLSVLHI